MKALVKSRAEPGLWLEDVPEPEIGINDVLIRVKKTGICGTDVHIYNWDAWAQQTIPVPMVVGHEFVGEIVEVGGNVNDFRPGDLVSGEGHVVCGRCRNCLAGRRHLCAAHDGIGVNRPGAFAEYLSLPMTNVWHHGPSIDRRRRRDLRSARQRRPHGPVVPRPGEDVLITGAGPIGCMAAAVARHAGARHVVVTDLNPYRLELARRWARRSRSTRASATCETLQQQLGMKEGFDVGLEMSGNPDALPRRCIANMATAARSPCSASPRADRDRLDTVIFNMLTIKGIYGREMYETWYKMTVMIQSGLDIRP